MIQEADHGHDLHDHQDMHNLSKEMLGNEITGSFHGGILFCQRGIPYFVCNRGRDFIDFEPFSNLHDVLVQALGKSGFSL